MGKQKPKIVDLELYSDGAYGPVLNIKNVKPLTGKPLCKSVVKPQKPKQIPKHLRPDVTDTFLGGIDIGLDFIDKIIPRVDRFLKM